MAPLNTTPMHSSPRPSRPLPLDLDELCVALQQLSEKVLHHCGLRPPPVVTASLPFLVGGITLYFGTFAAVRTMCNDYQLLFHNREHKTYLELEKDAPYVKTFAQHIDRRHRWSLYSNAFLAAGTACMGMGLLFSINSPLNALLFPQASSYILAFTTPVGVPLVVVYSVIVLCQYRAYINTAQVALTKSNLPVDYQTYWQNAQNIFQHLSLATASFAVGIFCNWLMIMPWWIPIPLIIIGSVGIIYYNNKVQTYLPDYDNAFAAKNFASADSIKQRIEQKAQPDEQAQLDCYVYGLVQE